MDNSDIVDDIFSRVREILGENFNGEVAVRLKKEEEMVRKMWGGSDIYVPKIKRESRQIKKNNVLKDINRGNRINDVAQKHGISRTQIYEYIKKR